MTINAKFEGQSLAIWAFEHNNLNEARLQPSLDHPSLSMPNLVHRSLVSDCDGDFRLPLYSETELPATP